MFYVMRIIIDLLIIIFYNNFRSRLGCEVRLDWITLLVKLSYFLCFVHSFSIVNHVFFYSTNISKATEMIKMLWKYS